MRRCVHSIIHDDAGAYGMDGILDTAVPLANKYNLKLCLAPYCSYLIEGSKRSDKIIGQLKDAIAAGHEIANHSFSHIPEVVDLYDEKNRGITFQNVPWGGKERVYKEVLKSQDVFEKLLNYRPSFFVFPYDYIEDDVIDLLINNGFIGARGGRPSGYNVGNLNCFKLNFAMFDGKKDSLIDFVAGSIKLNAFSIREMHNVSNELNTWGCCSVYDYNQYLSFIKDNEITCKTPSEICTSETKLKQ